MNTIYTYQALRVQKNKNTAFTLIELLVVIAIIGILASVVLSSLNSARGKARDAQMRSTMRNIASAVEVYRNDTGIYPASQGWLDNAPNSGNLGTLIPAYLSSINTQNNERIMYWRKDYPNSTYPCMTLNNSEKYGFYAVLRKPTSQDLQTLANPDSFDQCIITT